MQKSTENVAKSLKFYTVMGNLSRRIERRCLSLHQKSINNRFCARALQMLLKWPLMRLYAQLLKSNTVNRRRGQRLQ